MWRKLKAFSVSPLNTLFVPFGFGLAVIYRESLIQGKGEGDFQVIRPAVVGDSVEYRVSTDLMLLVSLLVDLTLVLVLMFISSQCKSFLQFIQACFPAVYLLQIFKQKDEQINSCRHI